MNKIIYATIMIIMNEKKKISFKKKKKKIKIKKKIKKKFKKKITVFPVREASNRVNSSLFIITERIK